MTEMRTVIQEKVECPECQGEGVTWCDGPSELGPGPYTCDRCHGDKLIWRNKVEVMEQELDRGKIE